MHEAAVRRMAELDRESEVIDTDVAPEPGDAARLRAMLSGDLAVEMHGPNGMRAAWPVRVVDGSIVPVGEPRVVLSTRGGTSLAEAAEALAQNRAWLSMVRGVVVAREE